MELFLNLNCAVLMFLLNSNLFAQARNQVFTGARPLALGEAFVAVADDGNAIYWNPAGRQRVDEISDAAVNAQLDQALRRGPKQPPKKPNRPVLRPGRPKKPIAE